MGRSTIELKDEPEEEGEEEVEELRRSTIELKEFHTVTVLVFLPQMKIYYRIESSFHHNISLWICGAKIYYRIERP